MKSVILVSLIIIEKKKGYVFFGEKNNSGWRQTISESIMLDKI